MSTTAVHTTEVCIHVIARSICGDVIKMEELPYFDIVVANIPYQVRFLLHSHDCELLMRCP
jgi:hypothetical protein